ncbi:hypothetical protein ACKKBG_A08255 [Auxenochlorella protothecoides x Auxenochlorella symbiontica]
MTPLAESTAPTTDTVTVSELLQLDPSAFIEDLHNAAHCHCADAFDDLDEAIRNDVGPALSPAQQAAVMQGTAQLYNLARGSLDRQLQRFEEFALETCLRVPAGLMASVQIQAPVVDVEAPCGEEEEGVIQRLGSLRAQILEEREKMLTLQRQLAACDAALAEVGGEEAGLRQLASAVREKERLTEDVFVLSHTGARLQGLLGDLQRLSVARHQGQESEGRFGDSLHGALNLMQAAPVESLQALHKTLVA